MPHSLHSWNSWTFCSDGREAGRPCGEEGQGQGKGQEGRSVCERSVWCVSADAASLFPYVIRSPMRNAQPTMEWLLSPITQEEFFSQYWEKKPLFISRKNKDYYGDL